jgi:hypothetical protein
LHHAGNRPKEAGQFASDGGDDLGAGHAAMSEGTGSPAQSHLCAAQALSRSGSGKAAERWRMA